MSCSDVRLHRLRAFCDFEDINAFYVRETPNIRWLTDFDDVFDEEAAHGFLVTADMGVLHTDSRYEEACRRAAAGSPFIIDSDSRSHSAFVADWLSRANFHRVVPGLEGLAVADYPAMALAREEEGRQTVNLGIENSMSLREFRALETAFSTEDGPRVNFIETEEVLLTLRSVKDAQEQARLHAAQAITDDAFAYLIDFIRPGMTEREVRLELEDYMLSHGAQDLAFPSIVAAGANGASPHAIPGDTVLEAGQCVVMDFGCKVLGYCSDMTRTVFLGEPSEEARCAYEVLREANEQVEAMLAPGVTGREAHLLAERVLEEGGFGGKMGHSLGHGVGLEVHEKPMLSRRNDQPLLPGNVVTVEPGIYLPGRFGMRLEDFGVITEEGFEVFTATSHDLVII